MESKILKFEDCTLEIEKCGSVISIYQQVIAIDLDEAGHEAELLEDWLIGEVELIAAEG